LIVEIGLEPEHDLVPGGGRSEPRIPLLEVAQYALYDRRLWGAEKSGAASAQTGGVEARWDRSLVKDVPPRQDLAGETGGGNPVRRAISVRDVKHAQ
jgi:hypothetical protein